MQLISQIGDIAGLISFIFAVLQYLYYNQIKFYIWVNKIIWWRKDTNFEIVINSIDSVTVDDIFKDIKNKTKIRHQMISRAKTRVLFFQDGLNIEIAKNENKFEDEYDTIITIRNTSSTYKESLYRLRKSELIYKALPNNMKFEGIRFKTTFKNKNPFLGPSISKIKMKHIKNCMITMNSDIFGDNQIEGDIAIGLHTVSFIDDDFANVKLIGEALMAV